MRTMIRRLRGDRRGGVTMIVAGGGVALLGLLAVTVDMGSAYLSSRQLQGIADAAALAAVSSATDPAAAAARAIAANGWTAPYTIALENGGYAANPTLAPSARFTAGSGSGAVRVTLVSSTPTFFAGAMGAARAITVRRTATATRADSAAFSIGSRLASVNGGFANALLSALLGTSVSLSAMDYNQLLGADIDALAFSKALRSDLHLGAASFADALSETVTMPQALTAMADALDAGGQSGAAGTLRKIAAQSGQAPNVTPADLLDLGPYGPQDHVANGTEIPVDAYSMLGATLELADAGHEMQLDLGTGVPGVAATRAWLAIGERAAHSPWLTVTDSGEPILRTAQSRLFVTAAVTPPAALVALGVPSLSLPLYVELAEAEAKLSAIACPGGAANAEVTLSVLPGIGHASIATVNTSTLASFGNTPAESPAMIARSLLLTVSGQSRLDLSASPWQDVSFSAADIANRTVKTVSSSGIVEAITTSLVQRMNLQASVLGLGVNASAATAAVGSALQPVAPGLDALVDQLTRLLGLHYGEADVRVDGVRCGQPTLVM